MPRPGPSLRLAELSTDVPASVDLTQAAVRAAFARSGDLTDAEARVASLTERIRSGTLREGRLCYRGSAPVGLILWESGHPGGIVLHLLYLRPGTGNPETYGEALRLLAAEVAPPVFAPGGLVGLSDAEEEVLMRSSGFERFARSEMRWPPDAPLPTAAAPKGVRLRPVGESDRAVVAGLHREAFAGTFDQYLYLTDLDPARDSDRAVGEMMGGHWGEFLGWASSIAENDRGAVGASLVVRSSHGPLLISVMVVPAAQGRGVGRALVGANLAALRARGERDIVLNVTEGNARAVRLYQKLGFVRSLGPEEAWYSRAAVPVAPGESARPGSGMGRSRTRGAEGSRTRQT
jgi:ribosomal protein S18 acetylase RimI-like enzyme